MSKLQYTYIYNLKVCTLKLSMIFSDSSLSFSISSRNSSISLCAMSHFCSDDKRNVLSILLLRDFDLLRFIRPPPERSWELCDGVADMEDIGCRLLPSFGSTRLKYFSNMCVSADKTSFARLKINSKKKNNKNQVYNFSLENDNHVIIHKPCILSSPVF